MQGRNVAWLAYVPIPGAFLVPLLTARDDRLARFHAWQGGLAIGLLFAALAAVGMLHSAYSAAWLVPVAALILASGIVAIIVGLVGASRGRYTRIRGVWDILARMKRA